MRKHFLLALAATLLSVGAMGQSNRTTARRTTSPATTQTVLEKFQSSRFATATTPSEGWAKQATTKKAEAPATDKKQIQNSESYQQFLAKREFRKSCVARQVKNIMRSPSAAIDAPSGLTVNDNGLWTLDISWTASSTANVSGYIVLIVDQKLLSAVMVDTVPASQTSVTYNNIFQANSYLVCVSALADDGSYSEWVEQDIHLMWKYETFREVYSYAPMDLTVVLHDGTEVLYHLTGGDDMLPEDYDYFYFDAPENDFYLDIYSGSSSREFASDICYPGQRVYSENGRPSDLLNTGLGISTTSPTTIHITAEEGAQHEYVFLPGLADLATINNSTTTTITGATDITLPTPMIDGNMYTIAVREITTNGPTSWMITPLYNEVSMTDFVASCEAATGANLPYHAAGNYGDMSRMVDFYGDDVSVSVHKITIPESAGVSILHINAHLMASVVNNMYMALAKDPLGVEEVITPENMSRNMVWDVETPIAPGDYYFLIASNGGFPWAADVTITGTPINTTIHTEAQMRNLPFSETGMLTRDDLVYTSDLPLFVHSYPFTMTETQKLSIVLEVSGGNDPTVFITQEPFNLTDVAMACNGYPIGYEWRDITAGNYYLTVADLPLSLEDTVRYTVLLSTCDNDLYIMDNGPVQPIAIEQTVHGKMSDSRATASADYDYVHTYTFTLTEEKDLNFLFYGDSLYSMHTTLILSNTLSPAYVDADYYYGSFQKTLAAGTYYLGIYTALKNASYTLQITEEQPTLYSVDDYDSNVSGSFEVSNDFHRDLLIDTVMWNAMLDPNGNIRFMVVNSFVATAPITTVAYRIKNLEDYLNDYSSEEVYVRMYDNNGHVYEKKCTTNGTLFLSGLTEGQNVYVEVSSLYKPVEIEMWLLNDSPVRFKNLQVPSCTLLDNNLRPEVDDAVIGEYSVLTGTGDVLYTLWANASEEATSTYDKNIGDLGNYTLSMGISAALTGPDEKYYIAAVHTLDAKDVYLDLRNITNLEDVNFSTPMSLGQDILIKQTPTTSSDALNLYDSYFHTYKAYNINLQANHIYRFQLTTVELGSMCYGNSYVVLLNEDNVIQSNLISIGYGGGWGFQENTYRPETTGNYRLIVATHFNTITPSSLTFSAEDLTPNGTTAITLDEACEQAPVVATSALPLRKEVVLDETNATLVAGEDGKFRYSSADFFVSVTRTHLTAGEQIYAQHFLTNDSYMLFYKKNGTSWEKITHNDDNGIQIYPYFTSEELTYVATEDIDFAIVTTTYSPFEKAEGVVYISSTKNDMYLAWEELPIRPDGITNSYKLVVSKDHLDFPYGTDRATVLQALLQLKVQILEKYGLQEYWTTLPNEPELWNIDMENGIATISISNLTATVTFSIASALTDTEAETLASKYIHNNHLYIRTADGHIYDSLGHLVK